MVQNVHVHNAKVLRGDKPWARTWTHAGQSPLELALGPQVNCYTTCAKFPQLLFIITCILVEMIIFHVGHMRGRWTPQLSCGPLNYFNNTRVLVERICSVSNLHRIL